MFNVNISVFEPSEKLPPISSAIVFLPIEGGWSIGYFSNDFKFVEEDSQLNDIKSYNTAEVKCWFDIKNVNRAYYSVR